VDTELTDHRHPWSARPWLAAAGLAFIIACLVPPLSQLARRYLFVESIQFCTFALAAPALVALGAPWRLLPRGAARLAPRLAGAGRRWASFVATLSCLIAWVVLCLFWRVPSVLDGLARHPVLVLPEALTLAAAGLGLWLELVPAPVAAQPSAPRRREEIPRPERALVAALAMWSLWAIAYVLGFAHDSVVHAYDQAGSHLGTVADQEITAFLLWAAAGAAFAPVVFTVLLAWLKDSPEPAGRGPGSGVRGWGPRRATAAVPRPGEQSPDR
jgi:Cytochrome c oxidase caa3 assembly factor (Caa3_CtaG)